jgi:hypothetical protein
MRAGLNLVLIEDNETSRAESTKTKAFNFVLFAAVADEPSSK